MGKMKIEIIVEAEYLPSDFPTCVNESIENLGFKILKSRYIAES